MIMLKPGKVLLVFLCIVLAVAAAGCGTAAKQEAAGNTSSSGANTTPEKEISLTFSTDVYAPDDWAKVYAGFAKKYPNIKVTYEQFPVDPNQRADKIKTLYATHAVPDIVEFDNQTPWLPMYQEEFVVLDDMIASDPEFKLDTLYPGAVDYLKMFTNTDKIISLPGEAYPGGMIYNKTLFDKFKIPYPTDHMSWDEVAELAKKITREEDGQKYYGLWLSNWNSAYLINTMEIQSGISETNFFKKEIFKDEALIKRIMETALKVQKDPLVTVPYEEFTGGKMPFDQFNQGNVAMWPESLWTVVNLRMLATKGEIKFDWGVVTYPYLSWDNTRSGMQPGIQPIVINSVSKNKEAAFKFIKWYFSKDFQADRAKILGIIPSINDKAANTAFKTGEKGLDNWENVIVQPYKTQIPNTDAKTSGYDVQYNTMSVEAVDKLVMGSINVDEAIRTNKELAKKILDSIGKQ